MKQLTLDIWAEEYAVYRLPTGTELPVRLFDSSRPGLVSVTRTRQETSIVCPADLAGTGEYVERGWRAMTVRGPLEFTLTGIMAALSGALAAAGVTLFALSTYDTDHVLVKQADLQRAVLALREAGHAVHDDPPADAGTGAGA
ncbi:MAG: ACT domain-containing protein [Sciscionella sp.]